MEQTADQGGQEPAEEGAEGDADEDARWWSFGQIHNEGKTFVSMHVVLRGQPVFICNRHRNPLPQLLFHRFPLN
jgi:hypothetical protein